MKISIIFSLFLFLFFSCSNPCDNLDCGLHGMCNEQTESCICDQYYEGNNCELESRSKYLGIWSGTGLCTYSQGVTFKLDLTIISGNTVNAIILSSDMILQEYTFSGTLDENNDILIPDFKVPISTSTYFGNLVYIDESNIELTLNVFVNGELATCVYSLTR